MMFQAQGSTSSTLTPKARDLALAHFDHVEKQVALATTTAALIVTATALLLNAYLLIARDYQMFDGARTFGERFAFFLAGVSLVTGALCSLIGVFPNLSARWFTRVDIGGLFFFGTVGRMRREDYIREFRDASERNAFDNQILVQVWAKSRWLILMFILIRLAILFVTFGAILGVVVLIYINVPMSIFVNLSQKLQLVR